MSYFTLNLASSNTIYVSEESVPSNFESSPESLENFKTQIKKIILLIGNVLEDPEKYTISPWPPSLSLSSKGDNRLKLLTQVINGLLNIPYCSEEQLYKLKIYLKDIYALSDLEVPSTSLSPHPIIQEQLLEPEQAEGCYTASDEEDLLLPPSPAVIEIVPIIPKKREPTTTHEQPLSSSSKKRTLKRGKQPRAKKSKKEITSTSSNVTEAQLTTAPCIIHCISTILVSKTTNTVYLRSQKEIPRPRRMLQFLKTVKEASTYSSYRCNKKFPEIIKQQKRKKLHLIEILYALVQRNHYFFKQKFHTSHIDIKVSNLLNSLNHLYCQTQKGAITDNDNHHHDLQIFKADDTHIPEGIPVSILMIISPRYHEKSSTIRIQTTPFTEQRTLRDQLNSIERSLSKALNTLYEKHTLIKDKESLFIKCTDKSYILEQPANSKVPFKVATKVLSDIFLQNQQRYNSYFINTNEEEKTPATNKMHTSIQDIFKQMSLALEKWHHLVSSEPLSPLKSDEDSIPSTSFALVQSSSSKTTKGSLPPLRWTLPKIEKLQQKPLFSISTYKKASLLNITPYFLEKIKKIMHLPSYISQETIPNVPANIFNNQEQTLKTLFTLTCIYLNAYNQEGAIQQSQILLQSNCYKQLFALLKNLDKTYSETVKDEQKSSTSSFHPTLQQIANIYKIKYPALTQINQISLTYPNISCTFMPKAASLVIKTQTFTDVSPQLLSIKINKSLNILCYHLIKFAHLPTSNIISMRSEDPSHIITKTNLSHKEAIQECNKILNNISSIIRATPEFYEVKKYIFTSTNRQTTLSKITSNLSVTSNYLNKATEGQLLDLSQLPSHLHFTDLYFFEIQSTRLYYNCQYNLFTIYKNIQSNRYLNGISNRIHKWVSVICNENTETLTKNIIYKNVSAKKPVSFIPFLYRGIEQNALQLKHFLKTSSPNFFTATSIKHFLNILETQNQCLILLKTKWNSLGNDSIPTISALHPQLQKSLHFTEEEVSQLEIFLEDLPLPSFEAHTFASEDES